ncbi:MAG: FAD:protein FMN transferase, partial [Oscillospiraceae bacterium]
MNGQNLLKSVSLFLIITFLFCGCNNVFHKKPVESEIFVMDTYISQKAYGKKAENALKDVNTFLVDCENKLSLYKENSYISKINKDAGNKPVEVDTLTFDLIEKSVKYCELTNGEFDITIAPLTKLWGITNKNPAVPDIEKIMKAKKLVNYKNIILDEKENTVFLKEKNMAIDLGGIAKGYICKNIKE